MRPKPCEQVDCYHLSPTILEAASKLLLRKMEYTNISSESHRLILPLSTDMTAVNFSSGRLYFKYYNEWYYL